MSLLNEVHNWDGYMVSIISFFFFFFFSILTSISYWNIANSYLCLHNQHKIMITIYFLIIYYFHICSWLIRSFNWLAQHTNYIGPTGIKTTYLLQQQKRFTNECMNLKDKMKWIYDTLEINLFDNYKLIFK